MKYIVSEKQYSFICEQSDEVMDRKVQGAKALWDDTIIKWCKSHNDLCYFGGMVALWFIPVVGPYLSSALGTIRGVEQIKEGNIAEGVLSIISSPLALGRIIRILKLSKGVPIDKISELEKIQKIGIPLYVSEGKNSFINWLHKTYGRELNNQVTMTVLFGLKLQICDAIQKLKLKQPDFVKNLTAEQIKEIENNCKTTEKLF